MRGHDRDFLLFDCYFSTESGYQQPRRSGRATTPAARAAATQCHRTAHFLPDRLALASRNRVNG